MPGRKGLRELREEQGLTQEEVARRAGLSVRTIARIESGTVEPRSRTAILLANALSTRKRRVSLEEILGLKAAS